MIIRPNAGAHTSTSSHPSIESVQLICRLLFQFGKSRAHLVFVFKFSTAGVGCAPRDRTLSSQNATRRSCAGSVQIQRAFRWNRCTFTCDFCDSLLYRCTAPCRPSSRAVHERKTVFFFLPWYTIKLFAWLLCIVLTRMTMKPN